MVTMILELGGNIPRTHAHEILATISHEVGPASGLTRPQASWVTVWDPPSEILLIVSHGHGFLILYHGYVQIIKLKRL